MNRTAITRTLALAAVATIVLYVATLATAEGRAARVGHIPNGDVFSCGTCHDGGPPARNPFGAAIEGGFLDGGVVQWGPALAGLDSDGDGYDNGVELGDAAGAWTSANPDPTATVSNPGDSGSPACGNGIVDNPLGEEQCDGADLADETCESLELPAGTLACDADCLFNIEGCFATAECGNGIVEEGEDCDGGELAGADCLSLGFDGGDLTCRLDCKYDTTACTRDTPADCGNGVAEGEELCDGDDLQGSDCAQFGFARGDLACDPTCNYDISGCTDDVAAACGDGVVDASEDCDGEELAGADCASQGFPGGDLACAADCKFDTAGCTAPPEPDVGGGDEDAGAMAEDAGAPGADVPAGEPDAGAVDETYVPPAGDANAPGGGGSSDLSPATDAGATGGGGSGEGGDCSATLRGAPSALSLLPLLLAGALAWRRRRA